MGVGGLDEGGWTVVIAHGRGIGRAKGMFGI